jgi:hypothetical protein
MTQALRHFPSIAVLSGLVLALAACRSSPFDPPDVQGAPAMGPE